ncbi:hypothetical protein BDZ94DRAFT_721370 [Collybia nuda]|uniref:Brain protein I3 n=1 Tax=Collybia nuda TaxID=64659 RepID=A0A9P5Y6E4_9AGAR|nr:hypothetical protein BDZ94DRAFT_721370 [Collybia nuda]
MPLQILSRHSKFHDSSLDLSVRLTMANDAGLTFSSKNLLRFTPLRARRSTSSLESSQSLLPEKPRHVYYEHPSCPGGNHDRKTIFKPCGVLAAVFLFPIGLVCLVVDSDEVCKKCGLDLSLTPK